MPDFTDQSFAAELYEQLTPYAYDDANNYYDLALLVQALGALFQELDDLALADDQGNPGWAKLFDVDNAPVDVLAWTAQLVGVKLAKDYASDPELARAQIKYHAGFRRGSPEAIVEAVKATLTGTDPFVSLIERDGSPYHFRVVVNVDNVSDAQVTEAALISQKPAGLTYTLQVSGWDYAALLSGYATYSGVTTSFDTYHDLAVGP